MNPEGKSGKPGDIPGVRESRPWGRFEVLREEPKYKLKRIEINPGQRLSYQKHLKRKEHWMVVQGKAVVTLDGGKFELDEGMHIDIPRESMHRIANPGDGPLVFIEIQQGDYFGEDDVVRFEDDYGRK